MRTSYRRSISLKSHSRSEFFNKLLERNVEIYIDGSGIVDYSIEGKPVPFQPYSVRFVVPKEPRKVRKGIDDIKWLGKLLSLSPEVVIKLIKTIPPTSWITGYRLTQSPGGRRRSVLVKLQGNNFYLPIGNLSSGEVSHVLLHLATELARFSASYLPTVLILDEAISALDETGLRHAIHGLSGPDIGFQTVIAIPTLTIDYDELSRAGANVVWLRGKPPAVKIDQPRHT